MTLRIVRPPEHDGTLNEKKDKRLILSSALLGDDLAKNANEAILEARSLSHELWLNSEPLVMAFPSEDDGKAYLFPIAESLHNKLLLLDIWGSSLPHSIRSLKYLREWHQRYEASGLMIVGVHCPFFSFGKDKKILFDVCRKLDIKYPVVMDNDFFIWKSLDNSTWPRRVLISPKGQTVLDIDEEGHYDEMERTIQEQLRTMSPGLACPPLLKELYTPDSTGSEFFFGTKLARKFANPPAEFVVGEEQAYVDKHNSKSPLYEPWLEGKWVMREESIHPTTSMMTQNNGVFQITVRIKCKNVYIVAATKSKIPGEISKPVRMFVTLNRKNVLDDYFGDDLTFSESRKTQITLRDPRLLQVLKNVEGGPHELTFHFDNEGYETCEVFALFFENEIT